MATGLIHLLVEIRLAGDEQDNRSRTPRFTHRPAAGQYPISAEMMQLRSMDAKQPRCLTGRGRSRPSEKVTQAIVGCGVHLVAASEYLRCRYSYYNYHGASVAIATEMDRDREPMPTLHLTSPHHIRYTSIAPATPHQFVSRTNVPGYSQFTPDAITTNASTRPSFNHSPTVFNFLSAHLAAPRNAILPNSPCSCPHPSQQPHHAHHGQGWM